MNVSPRQLTGDTIVDDVAGALAHAGLDPASLVLEITETAMMRDTDVARRNLLALDELGVGLALDDFGTGYSSLTYLQQFPIDVVKIDKSFVATIGQRNRNPSLAPAIIQLAQTLDLVPVAEGVETHDQLVELRALGCDLVQGFLLHRPHERRGPERRCSPARPRPARRRSRPERTARSPGPDARVRRVRDCARWTSRWPSSPRRSAAPDSSASGRSAPT